MTIEQKAIEEFREKFPCRCRKCGNTGVNVYGECNCSYEISDEIIEPAENIESFLLQTIKETRKEVCKELIPKENLGKSADDDWGFGFVSGQNELRQEIINKANKLK